MNMNYLKVGTLPSKGTYIWDILSSENYLDMWTFLNTHGDRHHYTSKFDKLIGKKKMHGKCISETMLNSEYFKQKQPCVNSVLDYAEGLSSVHFLSLHAWNVYNNTRHSKVVDFTWLSDNIDEEDVWYQGVVFNLEFKNEIKKIQINNRFKDTLPYLKSGCSCLTYEPLVKGSIDGYRISKYDKEEAIITLKDFHEVLVNQY